MEVYSYKRIIQITAPLMLGTFVQSIVTMTDGIFVSRLGTIEIGAFGNGSLLYLASFMLCRGLADGAQITIARQKGEELFSKIGETLKAAQIFQLMITAFILFAFILFGNQLIEYFNSDSPITEPMKDFINVRLWGLLFATQHIVLVGFFIGLGRTSIIMVSALVIAVCNIFLDYVLINGYFGFPHLGLVGAPLASSISELIGFLFLLLYLLKNTSFKVYHYHLREYRIKLKEHLDLLYLSYPLMLQGVVALSTWLIFFTKVEGMGPEALEASHNIRYMYFLAFVPLFGFAASTKTIVSNLVGQKQLHLVPLIQNRILLLSLGFILFVFHGALLYPELLINLVDLNPTISEKVYADSVSILQFISGSILIYSIAIVYYNAISGLGKSRVYFGIELVAILLYLVSCHLFVDAWHWDIRAVWWVEYVYFITFAVLSIGYFVYYRKKYIQHV